MQTSNGIVEFMGRVFPPAVWLTKALASSGLEAFVNLLYLVAASVVSSAIVYFLATVIYQRGAMAQLEAEQKTGRKKLTYQAASPMLTIFLIEWRLLIRTPIYAMNSLVMIFVAPMLLLLPLMGGNFANDPDLKILFDAIRDAKSAGFVMLALAAFITMLTLINPAISSTFSREGKCFWMLKNIPVHPTTQVYGKFWAGYSISFMGALMAVIISAFSFQIPLDMCFLILLLCSLALVPMNAAGILIDLVRPKLLWNNAQEAIKQNANVVIAMVAGFFILFLYGLLGYFVLSFMTSLYGVFAIMASALILFSVLSFSLLNRVSRDAYQKIEA
jgi:ABC-2 type transport system permease protein